MAPSKKKVSKQSSDDEDYRKKRDRNNEVRLSFAFLCSLNSFRWSDFGFLSFLPFQAVKRSRVKAKQKTVGTKERVDDLKKTNEKLQERIVQKQKNLETLKSLFLETAKAKSEAPNGPSYDLKKLLADSEDEDD